MHPWKMSLGPIKTEDLCLKESMNSRIQTEINMNYRFCTDMKNTSRAASKCNIKH